MLNYNRFGSGPTFVMQHGFLGGGGYFAPQMAALGHAFDLIAPDLPGYAGSHAEPAVDTIKALSVAQIALLDQLGIDEFNLLGHSLGGMVALQTALDHPDRVKKLVLYATNSSGNLPGRFETFDETARRVAADGMEATTKRITATWFAEGTAAPMYPFCLQAGAGATLDAVNRTLTALKHFNVDERLGELKMPVLVISGDADRSYALEGLVRLTKAIPKAQLCLLPGGAHCIHLEQSGMFNMALERFLIES